MKISSIVITALLSLNVLTGCDKSSSNPPPKASSNPPPKAINYQEKAAFQLAEFKAKNGLTPCDKYSDFRLISPQYGTVTHDVDEYYRPFKLGSSIDAVITGVEFTCLDRNRGIKSKNWQHLIVAYDKEFDKFRCQRSMNATKYGPDGYTGVAYEPDGFPAKEVNEWKDKCGFVGK